MKLFKKLLELELKHSNPDTFLSAMHEAFLLKKKHKNLKRDLQRVMDGYHNYLTTGFVDSESETQYFKMASEGEFVKKKMSFEDYQKIFQDINHGIRETEEKFNSL